MLVEGANGRAGTSTFDQVTSGVGFTLDFTLPFYPRRLSPDCITANFMALNSL